MENNQNFTATNEVATDTTQVVKKSGFETLIQNLENGITSQFIIGKDQRLYLADEKDADGNLTGFKTVKSRGGNIEFGIAENILLRRLQSLLANKGVCEFRDQVVRLFGKSAQMVDGKTTDFTTENLQSFLLEKGITPKGLSVIVNQYLRQIEKVLILTDLQVLRVFQAVCRCQAISDMSQAIKQVTQVDRTAKANEASAYNEAIKAERLVMAEKLAKSKTA